jgi:hypothetical protein
LAGAISTDSAIAVLLVLHSVEVVLSAAGGTLREPGACLPRLPGFNTTVQSLPPDRYDDPRRLCLGRETGDRVSRRAEKGSAGGEEH